VRYAKLLANRRYRLAAVEHPQRFAPKFCRVSITLSMRAVSFASFVMGIVYFLGASRDIRAAARTHAGLLVKNKRWLGRNGANNVCGRQLRLSIDQKSPDRIVIIADYAA